MIEASQYDRIGLTQGLEAVTHCDGATCTHHDAGRATGSDLVRMMPIRKFDPAEKLDGDGKVTEHYPGQR
jgi:hypothetical protein